MTSEERLVAQVALELLAANSAIEPAVQLAISDDTEKLTLPCVVVTADRQGEEQAVLINGTYGSRYKVRVELRYIRGKHQSSELDELFAQIETTLNTAPTVSPASAAKFNQYIIISADGAGREEGETVTRHREYTVVAHVV